MAQPQRGPVDKVPCPHCGKPNDMSELADDGALHIDAEVDCDHCGRMMEVTSVTTVTLVGVVASNTVPRRSERPAAAASTVSQGTLQRLLGRGKR